MRQRQSETQISVHMINKKQNRKKLHWFFLCKRRGGVVIDLNLIPGLVGAIMNIFRLAGDMTHLLSIVVLLLKIRTMKSCSGIHSFGFYIIISCVCLFSFLFVQPFFFLGIKTCCVLVEERKLLLVLLGIWLETHVSKAANGFSLFVCFFSGCIRENPCFHSQFLIRLCCGCCCSAISVVVGV